MLQPSIVAEERNYFTMQLDAEKCYDVLDTPWKWVQFMKSTDLIGHVNILPWQPFSWLQCDHTLPLSVEGMA